MTDSSIRGARDDAVCSATPRRIAATDNVQLPYGLTAGGHLAHISEVPSGLACACTCPGCGERLVARRGGETTHHFAHHADRACKAAWETTLHLLAKEAVGEAREILLPSAVAEVEDRRRELSPAKPFRYDAVDVEVDMGGLRPDAVLKAGSRELLVEFWVAHRTEPAKREELRRRNLATIEIDLSKVQRHASRAHHVEQILRAAPRVWLHNAKVAQAEAELAQAAERRRATEDQRRHRRYGRLASELRAVWATPPAPGRPSWREAAHDAGHAGLIGIDVPGADCMAVDAACWQAAVLHYGVTNGMGETFTAKGAVNRLREASMLKQPFADQLVWPPDLQEFVREQLPGFRTPPEVVAAYAEVLVSRRVLTRTRKGWRADYNAAVAARQRRQSAVEAREREADLRDKAQAAVAAVPVEADTVDRWMGQRLPGFDASPSEMAQAGGGAYERLERQLVSLASMLRPGSSPVEGDLLGLPLEHVREQRAREQRARDDATRRAHEERQRRETAQHVEALTTRATKLLGDDAGWAWVERALATEQAAASTGGDLLLDWAARKRTSDALDREQGRVERARRDEDQRIADKLFADAEAATCRATLERKAKEHFMDDARAAVWLRSTQRTFSKSPWDHCVSQRALQACENLLAQDRKAAGCRR